MRGNQLKAGAFLSYLQTAVSVLVGLIYTPVMIRLLGQSEYGLYNTVASTISMLSVLSLGFNSGYIRYYAGYKKEENRDAINSLNGLFLLIFCIIGLVALACGLFLKEHLELVFKSGLTSEEYGIARTLMLLLTFNLAISFPMSVFQNIISAHERFVFLKLLGVLKTVLGPMLTLPLLLMGYRSVALVSVTVLVSLIADICYLVYVKKILKEKFCFRHFEKGLLQHLFTYTVFIALNAIIDQINWNVDKVLLGRFKGTEAVAIYAVGFTLYNYYMTISLAVSGVFTPRIHKMYNDFKDDPEKMNAGFTDLFIRVGRIQFLILGLVASGIVFFGRTFIHFWAGVGFEDAYPVALLLVLPASVALVQNVGIEVQRAQNKHQFRSIVYTFMALINLVLSWFLCQMYGPVGSAFGTAVSLIIANGIIMNIYYHRYCGIDIPSFWNNILRMSIGFLIPFGFGFIVNRFLPGGSIIWLGIGIVAYTLVYCVSVWMISMNDYEKTLISKPLRRILRRNG